MIGLHVGERVLDFKLDECGATSRNGRYCLLACFQKREDGGPYLPRDSQFAQGEEAVRDYFSGVFGGISDIPEFIKKLNGFEAREILARHNAYGEHDIGAPPL